MPLIEWTDDMNLGIKAIDAQHQVLVTFINELDEAQRLKQGHEKLAPIIDGLIDYTIRHFQYEEYQFKKHKYDVGKAHLNEHASFTQTVLGFKEQFDKGELQIGHTIMEFLKEWLIDHILKTDKEYAQYFAARLT